MTADRNLEHPDITRTLATGYPHITPNWDKRDDGVYIYEEISAEDGEKNKEARA